MACEYVLSTSYTQMTNNDAVDVSYIYLIYTTKLCDMSEHKSCDTNR